MVAAVHKPLQPLRSPRWPITPDRFRRFLCRSSRDPVALHQKVHSQLLKVSELQGWLPAAIAGVLPQLSRHKLRLQAASWAHSGRSAPARVDQVKLQHEQLALAGSPIWQPAWLASRASCLRRILAAAAAVVALLVWLHQGQPAAVLQGTRRGQGAETLI